MAKKNYMSKNGLAYFWQILKNTFAKKTELSTVATSGSYNDLSNKPTIPTKNSQLANDSGFIINEKEIFIGEEKDVPAEAKIIIDPSNIGTGIAFEDSVPINTIFEYDGDKVPDGYEEVKIEDKGEIYSTDEQKIGTWIDGKPIYRKVVTGTTSVVSYGEIETNIPISDVDTIISYSANINNWIITYLTRLIYISSTKLRLDILNQGSGSGFASSPFKCIVEYTKTTD